MNSHPTFHRRAWILVVIASALAAAPAHALMLPKVPRVVLKEYFEKGDKPTEAQFGTLIDSMIHNTTPPGGLSPALPITLNGIGVFGSTNNALRLGEGTEVGAAITYADVSIVPRPPLPDLETLWAGQSGYLPLRFTDTGVPYPIYGYLQISMDSPPANLTVGLNGISDPPAINVEYLLYESSNAPLVTSPVPEPTGLLAIAALGVALRRSRVSRR